MLAATRKAPLPIELKRLEMSERQEREATQSARYRQGYPHTVRAGEGGTIGCYVPCPPTIASPRIETSRRRGRHTRIAGTGLNRTIRTVICIGSSETLSTVIDQSMQQRSLCFHMTVHTVSVRVIK